MSEMIEVAALEAHPVEDHTERKRPKAESRAICSPRRGQLGVIARGEQSALGDSISDVFAVKAPSLVVIPPKLSQVTLPVSLVDHELHEHAAFWTIRRFPLVQSIEQNPLCHGVRKSEKLEQIATGDK